MRGTGPAYAAVDLGTNNCRMLVARPTPRGFRVIDSFSRVVRLGEGLTGSGALNDDAIVRTIDALQICADKMRDKHVRQHRVVATEACRQAAEVMISRCSHFRLQPRRTNSTASQSSSSGCEGGSP